MNIDKIREWYNNPPRANDIAAWAEIHRAMGTPDGSDATMRAWAMQTMSNAVLEYANRNNAAPTATLAQDEAQCQHAQTVNQEAGSDPRAVPRAMRKDLARLFALSGKMHDFWSDEDYEEYKAIGKKWGLQ